MSGLSSEPDPLLHHSDRYGQPPDPEPDPAGAAGQRERPGGRDIGDPAGRRLPLQRHHPRDRPHCALRAGAGVRRPPGSAKAGVLCPGGQKAPLPPDGASSGGVYPLHPNGGPQSAVPLPGPLPGFGAALPLPRPKARGLLPGHLRPLHLRAQADRGGAVPPGV